jgi:succinate dehydrogenase / fumarate reductase cytochrome b subunit
MFAQQATHVTDCFTANALIRCDMIFHRTTQIAATHASSTIDTSRPRLSSVNAKLWMAITGSGLLLFVIVHMLGNLQIYWGQEALNSYAKKLKSLPLLLWTARLGLLALFTMHLGLAIRVKLHNRLARPERYVINDPVETTLAPRTMFSSGLVIMAFVTYHLLHFTFGVTDPIIHTLVDQAGHHDVYSMVVLSFQNVYVSAAYIIAMIFLAMHLSHASSSIFQTLGATGSTTRKHLYLAGQTLAIVILLGNASIPVAVMLGLLDLPGDGATP